MSGIRHSSKVCSNPMKILLATSELFPYSKTGGLADMVAALGKSLAQAGHQVSVVTPLYKRVREQKLPLQKLDWNLDIPLDWRMIHGDIYRLKQSENLSIYFIEQPGYFDRNGIYNENNLDYGDNAERFIFFCKAVVNLAQYMPEQPEVIHVHDWQTGCIPLLIRELRDSGKLTHPIKTCLTIHNLAYQGVFHSGTFQMLNLPWHYFSMEECEYYGNLNMLKTGIVFADALTTVSPKYAKEILGAEYGENLNNVLRARSNILTGILNGADYDIWQTEENPALPYPYSGENMSGKTKNKIALQKELGLPVNPDIPVFGNIGRMAEQKGIDIMLPAIEDILDAGIQFVCLGSGLSRYEDQINRLQSRYPDKVAVYIGYNDKLAHRVTAGIDFFVMPSRYEPCGLNQMYSLRFGTIPIVRATGGLDDSVIDTKEDKKQANGFKFYRYTPLDLGRTMIRALAVYYSPTQFKQMQQNAISADFSWKRTAQKYTLVYQDICKA